jgi:hypothetical protein
MTIPGPPLADPGAHRKAVWQQWFVGRSNQPPGGVAQPRWLCATRFPDVRQAPY